MVTLFVIALIIIIILKLSGKKKPGKITSFSQPPRQPELYQSQPINATAVKLANQHFGVEWQRFLTSNNARLNVTNQHIREVVARAYSKMGAPDLTKLLLSYNLPNGYKALHVGIYKLIMDKKFLEIPVLQFLKSLASKASIAQPIAVSPKPVTFEIKREDAIRVNSVTDESSLHSILQSVNNSSPQLSRTQTDESIIELSAQPVPIDSKQLPPLIRTVDDLPYLAGYDPDQYSLGKKYKKKLNLSTQEAAWLNKFTNYSNVFNGIEGCEIEIVKLFLLSVKVINKQLKKEDSTLTQEIEPLKHKEKEIYKNQPGYWGGYDEYLPATAESEVYRQIYRKAEMAVRDAWSHKRKLTGDFYSNAGEVKFLFDKRLAPLIDETVDRLIPTIAQPDEATQIALNEVGTTRWKDEFESLTESYKGTDHSELVSALYKLGSLNAKNPNVEHIFYESSKFLASFDKLEALKFYLHYIWHDLRSVQIDNKMLNKTVQKKLFANEEQIASFQTIVEELTLTKHLDKALLAVEHIYKTKRKNIVLDHDVIKRVEKQHSGTVEILSEYLKDEVEEVHVYQTPVVIASKLPMLPEISAAVNLAPVQQDCLHLFRENNYHLSAGDIEAFAKSRSLFKNQLIDSVNDSCYELLDDVLIEESDEYYEINPDYYKKIFI